MLCVGNKCGNVCLLSEVRETVNLAFSFTQRYVRQVSSTVRGISTVSVCFTCVLCLILQKTRVVIGMFFRLQGKGAPTV